MRIGAIIPTRNEEGRIALTIESLRAAGRPALIIVADCGSTDRTRPLAQAAGAVVVNEVGWTCRSAALRGGAEAALERCGDLDALFFLHADSSPGPRWDEAIAAVLRDPRVVGGAFDFEWDLDGVPWRPRALLQAICWYNRVRMRVTRSYYGDQGIFVRPAALAMVGGVPPVALLEDRLLCRRLKRAGRLCLARGRTRTSPRRFMRHGIIRQAAIDGLLLAAHGLGVEPTTLHDWYNREKE